MSDTLRTLRWFAINGGFAVVIYYGFVKDVEGARNVALFYVWFISILSLFFVIDKVIEETSKTIKDRTFPKWIDITYDVGITLALAYFGCFASAVAYAFHILFTNYAYDEALKRRDSKWKN